ncbi:MAG: hypothetical protein JW909_00110 [Planctomycetes bacterium]|nr:hypothetical protein [Planctomycetota bacterium]
MRELVWGAVLAALAASGTAAEGKGEEEFTEMKVAVMPQAASVFYKMQLIGPIDHEVGKTIELPGTSIPTMVDDKGRLEIQIGKSKQKLSGPRSVHVKLPKETGKRQFTVILLFRLTEERKWIYRNVTDLKIMAGKEKLVIVDVNCNGVYNEAGTDGMAWDRQEFLFPLPAAEERWCTRELELKGLRFGPQGDDMTVEARPLTTTEAGALGILKGVNEERVLLGVTPRPENVRLSEELQKHCHYMKLNDTLGHSEDPTKAGYTPEGLAAGQRSILSMGRAPAGIAMMMVNTLFHRYDVIRHNTTAFGVGYEGRYGGIDGRTDKFEAPAAWWPLRCPAPGQQNVRHRFEQESPQPIQQSTAGFPITMYFNTKNLKLKAHSLKELAGQRAGQEVECYAFDPETGDNHSHMGYQSGVALIPKAPLSGGMEYEVSMTVAVDGKENEYRWRFRTQ